MPDKVQQRHRTIGSSSLHKPLTYWALNAPLLLRLRRRGRAFISQFHPPGIAVFIGVSPSALGNEQRSGIPSHLAKSERYKPRYDAAKQQSACGGRLMLRLDKVIKP